MSRRSQRISLKFDSLDRTRTHKLVKNFPLTIYSYDDGDDDDMFYVGSKPLTMIDSTKPSLKTPSKQHIYNEKSLVISNQIMQKSPVKKRSQFKEPDVTPPIANNISKDQIASPPKQRKINEENVRATPPSTPTVLLENLSLTVHKDRSNGKKLFEEYDPYQNARKALHSTIPTKMPGREKELSDLREFILELLKKRVSGTLYISGPPGTGKTASLKLILEEEKISSEVNDIYVNCTSIKSSNSIFLRITKALGIKVNSKTEKNCSSAIENYLKKNQKPVLLLLDEIDQLESKNQSVLYTIFEWPSIPNSKLILIGIANALDLTDRILPRLQARCELKPKLVHFAPYTKQQIVDIFTDRLKDAGVLDIFSPAALQMLAGKVAAISGDVRRALDIGRRVVEFAERKKSVENVLQSVENLAEELESVDDERRKVESVDLHQVINVLNNVYSTSQSLNDDADESFPLQQKIVVCSLLLILKKMKMKNKEVTIGRLHEVYRKVCLKRNIQVVDHGEFVGLCSLIETRGILKVIRKKDPRMSKVNLMWDEEEVAAALKDKQLISTILEDDMCLGKL